jgi:N-acetylmuramoyl-L-alanine amidase
VNYRDRPRTSQIIVHDAHTPKHLIRVETLLRAKGRAKGLLDIGYHFIIEGDGRVVSGRNLESIGSHTPGHNHDSVAICVAGGEDGVWHDNPKAMAALTTLIVNIKSVYGDIPVYGHYERMRLKHQCPCFNMDDVRSAVRVLEHEDGTEYPVVPTEDKLTEQHRLILEYLKAGFTLTNHHAIIHLGVGSLSSRIAELRRKGFEIGEEWDTDFHGRRYKKYRLVENDGA